jgi:hypothetical protein
MSVGKKDLLMAALTEEWSARRTVEMMVLLWGNLTVE